MQNERPAARRRRLLFSGIVAAVALLTHAFWFLEYAPDAPDSASYLVPAHALVAHHAFLEPRLETTLPRYDPTPPLVPATFRTPGYPLFLAAFLAAGQSLRTISLVQHLLVVALTVAFFFAAARVTRSEETAFVAAFLFALYPPVAQFTNGILSEALFLVLFTMAVAALYVAAAVRARARWGGLAGLLVGMAVLVRPVAMYYVVPAALFLILARRERRIPAMLAFVAAALLLPSAWVARNARETGVATLSSLPPENLLFFNAAGAVVASERGPFATVVEPRHSNRFIDDVRARFPELYAEARAEARRAHRFAAAPRAHVEMSPYFRVVAMRLLRAHPAGLFWSSVSGAIGFYTDSLWQVAAYYLGYPLLVAQLLLIPVAIAFFFLALLGLHALGRIDRRLALLLFLTIAYFTAVSAAPATDYRLAIPIAPYYALCIAAGVLRFVPARRRHG